MQERPEGRRAGRRRRRHPRPARRQGEAGARHAGRACQCSREPRPGPSRDLEVLHRPAGLRRRPVDRHRAGGPRGHARAADLAVSADRAARGGGDGELSRRHRRDHRLHRGGAARAADQRRRTHDLHALDLDRLGHDEPHHQLRDRHQSRPERHQRQQSRAARAAAAAGGGRAPGRRGAEALDLDPDGDDHVVARPALRHGASSATTRW